MKDVKKKNDADEEVLRFVSSVILKGDVLALEAIVETACRFTEQLLENTYSPAEAQSYLNREKCDTGQALEEACNWRDGVLTTKKKRAKVVYEK